MSLSEYIHTSFQYNLQVPLFFKEQHIVNNLLFNYNYDSSPIELIFEDDNNELIFDDKINNIEEKHLIIDDIVIGDTIKTFKKADKNISLRMIKNIFDNKEFNYELNDIIETSIIKKKEWLMRRIEKNNMKLSKLIENNKYFENSIKDEIFNKGLSKKLYKVNEKRIQYFNDEIDITSKRLSFLHSKLNTLENPNYSFENYINLFANKNFQFNNNDDIISNFNIISNHKNSGEFYDDLFQKKNKKIDVTKLKNNFKCLEKILFK
jgi:hypothetical protein